MNSPDRRIPTNEDEIASDPASVLASAPTQAAEPDVTEAEIVDDNDGDETADDLDAVIPPHLPDSLPVVGLGGSAGAIPPLREFFTLMPSDSGIAFVVVMHLAPDHVSSLPEILQNTTSMPVLPVNKQIKLEANHVYVIPPNMHLSMMDGQILPQPRIQENGKRVAVDLFFRALADTHGAAATGIILSGADSDGTIGLKRIKERGGLTVAQEPDEAEHSSMPRAAISTGMVDWVLPVEEMPARLLGHVKNEKRLRLPPEAVKPLPAAEQKAKRSKAARRLAEIDENALREILSFLNARTGHDFTHYKRATVLRRIGRRLQVNGLADLPSYVDFLRAHPGEAGALLQDLLISVTNFFRDPETFRALEAEVPRLFHNKSHNDEVRVWVAGCATGEEAYSVAMLLAEHASKFHRPPSILVFATDLSDSAIETAREGCYSLAIEADVSFERLRRFFVLDNGCYRVRRELREMILFASHNLLKDSPFSRLDLVSCRNLLIYLNREAQQRAFATFHFSLKSDGLLFLGTSESADDAKHLFALHNKKHRLYHRRPAGRHVVPPLPPPGARALPAPPPALSPGGSTPALLTTPLTTTTNALASTSGGAALRHGNPTFGDLHLALLERLAPPSVVVNEEYEIIHLSESAGRFLQFAGGEPSTNLLRVVHPMLRLELGTALFTATQRGEDVRVAGVPVDEAGEVRQVNLFIRPIRDVKSPTPRLIVVLFEETGQDASTEAVPRTEFVARQLDEELQQLKANLRSTVEQYEVSVEELKASNEELQAMNEEARSTSEELETSKEELQSVNEELTTVNQELSSKVEELSRSNSDLQNLMASTDIATLFLDRGLRIKRYTPRAARLFHIIPTDVNRPLTDLTHKLEYSDLANNAEHVLKHLAPVEKEVRSADGEWFYVRILPYRTGDDRIDGVVLTLLDISGRKRAEDELRESEERMRLLIESAKDYAIFTIDTDRCVTSWNSGAQALLGYTESEIIGKSGDIIFTVEDRAQGAPEREVQTARAEGRAENERFHVRKDGSRFYGSGVTTPMTGGDGELTGFVKIMRDLTESQLAAETIATDLENTILLRDMGIRLTSEGDTDVLYREILDVAITLARADGGTIQILDESTRELVLIAASGFDESMTQRFARVDASSNTPCGTALARGERVYVDYDVPERQDPSGTMRMHVEAGFLSGQSIPLISRSGKRLGMISTHWHQHHRPSERELHFLDLLVRQGADLIRQRQTASALRESERQFRRAVEEAPVPIIMCAEDGEVLQLSRNWIELTGYGREDLQGFDSWLNIACEKAADSVRAQMQELFKGKKHSISLDFPIRTRGGEERQWSFSASVPGTLRDGRRFIVGMAVDVTERMRVVEKLRESQDRLAQALSAGRMAFWDWDTESDRVTTSDSAPDIFGLLPGEELDSSTYGFGLVHPDELERYRTRIQQAVARDEGWRSEFRIIRPRDGQVAWLEERATITPAPEGGKAHFAGLVWEITERKKAEIALRETQERFRLLVQGIGDYAIFMLDLEGRITSWNEGVERLLGYSEAEWVGQSGAIIFTPEDRAQNVPEKEAETALREGSAPDERWHIRKDGTRFFANGVLTVVGDEDGQPRAFAKILRDETERKKTEELLHESRLELDAALTIAQIGTWRWQLPSDFCALEDACVRVVGLPPGSNQLSIEQFLDLVHPDYRDEAAKQVQRTLREHTPFEIEAPFTRPIDGQTRWIFSKGNIIDPGSDMIIGAAIDITQRKHAEIELQRANDELEQRVQQRTTELRRINKELEEQIAERQNLEVTRQRLLERVVATQEDERRRISRELHDQMGQHLTALLLGLKTVPDGRGSTRLQRTERLEQLQKLVSDLMSQVHNLAWELRPAALDNLGLEAALQQYSQEWSQQSGIKAVFVTRNLSTMERLPAPLEIAFYRVVQEALTNVQRHADATQVSITLETRGAEIVAVIEDNGHGFPPELIPESGSTPIAKPDRLGLMGMRERLELIGGELAIESDSGGTTVYARAPIDRRKQPRN